jgi:nitrous oxidase accessory protein NosD
MAYTLRGRLETRFATAAVALATALVACALTGKLWPLEVVALMVLVGLALDVVLLHRAIPYQPGWAALPIGTLELGLTMLLAWALGVPAPIVPAIALFAVAWLLAQALGHAALPLLHHAYAEDGGELGRAGPALAGAGVLALTVFTGFSWPQQPPLVRLPPGVHEGPLLIDRPVRLVGSSSTVVRGGVRITADDAELHDVTVVGGEVGIEVHEADGVVLDGVRVHGAALDGISARGSAVTIRDCVVTVAGPYTQGIDVSFGMDGHSTVERCDVHGGQDGILVDGVHADVRDNRVSGTHMHGISMNEMAMGHIEGNSVGPGVGIGIYCGDYSVCEVEDNHVSGVRPDGSDNVTQRGIGIVADYHATAEVENNRVTRSPVVSAAFLDAQIVRE